MLEIRDEILLETTANELIAKRKMQVSYVNVWMKQNLEVSPEGIPLGRER